MCDLQVPYVLESPLPWQQYRSPEPGSLRPPKAALDCGAAGLSGHGDWAGRHLPHPVAVGTAENLRAFGYAPVKEIGKGAFGRAILVHNADGQACVVKEVNMCHMLDSERELARREIRVLRSFGHANIIRCVVLAGTAN